MDVGAEYAVCSEHSGVQVRHRHADLDGWRVGHAGDAHQAAHTLGDEVVAGSFGVRTGAAESRDRAVNEGRIGCRHLLVSQAETVHRSRPVVFDHYVGVFCEPTCRFESALLFEVQHHATLVAVHGEKCCRLTAHKGRAHVAGIIPPRRLLDLDDVCAHVGQEHRAKRPRQDLAAVHDLHPFQGQRHR